MSGIPAGWFNGGSGGSLNGNVNDLALQDASSGEYYGPVQRIYPPPAMSGWSWFNQGSASYTQTSNAVFLQCPGTGTANIAGLVKAAPSTPYTVTAAFLPAGLGVNYLQSSLCWRASGSGALVTVGVANGQLYVSKWDSPTTFSADYVSALALPARGPVYLRLADNGTNRTVAWSADGVSYETVHTVGRTDFLTANQVGFCVNSENSGSTYRAAMRLLSWLES